MKDTLNTALVKSLASLITGHLAAIDKEERKLVKVLASAWSAFITGKDGSAEHWTYFNEDGSVKRHGVVEFRNAALAAAEKGGYSRTYMSEIVREVSEDFQLRKSAPKTGRKKNGVKFSKEQLASVEKAALQVSLSREAIKKLLAALAA